MPKTETGIEIGKLLVDYMQNKCSQADNKRIEEWLKDEDHARLFDNLKKTGYKEFRDKYTCDLDTQKIKFEERLNKRKRSKLIRRRISIISKYAAVVLVFISLGIVYQYSDSFITKKTQLAQPILLKKSKEVVLQLASGEKVLLSNNVTVDSIKGNAVSNVTNKSIVYNSESKSEIIAYNTVKVPCNGEFYLELSDGTKVWMNADSKLKYPVNFIGDERKIWLEGEAYMEVAHDKDHPFIVGMNKSQIKVLGTKFNARNYKDEFPTTTLVEGKVEISDENNNKIILKPGQQAIVRDNRIVTKEVEVFNYIVWKDGYFVFEDITLDNVLKQLSQWYGFNYFYQNSEVSEYIFSAKIKKYESLDQTLKIIENTQNVRFRIKDNTVVVCSK